MDKLNIRKKFRELNEWVSKDNYDAPKTLKVTETGFNAFHLVDRDFNGVSKTLSLQDRITDAKHVHVELSSRYGILEIYINSRVKNELRWGNSGTSYLLKVRKGNKTQDLVIHPNDEHRADPFKHIFGYDLQEVLKPEFEEYIDTYKDGDDLKVISIDGATISRPKTDYEVLGREFTTRFYLDTTAYHEIEHALHRDSRLKKLCEATGYKILALIAFTDKYIITPKYIKKLKNGIELGWFENNTYNSLPRTLKIEMVKEIVTVSLADLDIEDQGYYDHSRKMQILPEQVEISKAFMKRFRNNKEKTIKQTLDYVKKCA